MGERGLTPSGVLMIALALLTIAHVPVRGHAHGGPGPAHTLAHPAPDWVPPRTAWGDPDLQGIWNSATMTPLERPRALGLKEVFTAAEAAAYEQETLARQAATNNTAGPDWWDPGTRHLMNRRTSLIIDPPDGRIPAATADAQRRAAERADARRRRGQADGPE